MNVRAISGRLFVLTLATLALSTGTAHAATPVRHHVWVCVSADKGPGTDRTAMTCRLVSK